MKSLLFILFVLICTQAYSQKLIETKKGEFYLFSYDLGKGINNSKTYCVGKPECDVVWNHDTKTKTLRVEPTKGGIRSIFEFSELNLKNAIGDKIHLEYNQNNQLGKDAKFFIEVENNFGKINKYYPTEKGYQLIDISKSKTRGAATLKIRLVVETTANFRRIGRPSFYEIKDFINCIFCCGGTNGQSDPIGKPR